jgi:hypothetical protein
VLGNVLADEGVLVLAVELRRDCRYGISEARVMERELRDVARPGEIEVQRLLRERAAQRFG